jgi:hypothetical protein
MERDAIISADNTDADFENNLLNVVSGILVPGDGDKDEKFV